MSIAKLQDDLFRPNKELTSLRIPCNNKVNMTMLNNTTNTTKLLDSQLHFVAEDEGSSLLFFIVTGIACTILIFTAFMPFAQRWDKNITRKCAGNTVYVVQHLGDDASSIFSDVVFCFSCDGDVEDCSKESKPLEIALRPDIEQGNECMIRNHNKREEGDEVSIIINKSFLIQTKNLLLQYL